MRILLLALAVWSMMIADTHARTVVMDMDKLEKTIKVDGTVDESNLRSAISREAYNPEAAQFRNTKLVRSVSDFPVLCGEVNIVEHEAGKNWQRFVHAGDPVLEEASGFERKWKQHCE